MTTWALESIPPSAGQNTHEFTVGTRVLVISLFCGLFCGCYRQSKPEDSFILLAPVHTENQGQGGEAAAIIWTAITIAANVRYLASVGSSFTCTGIVVDTDGKGPLPGALVMMRAPRSGRMVMATTRRDGSFVLSLKNWGAGTEVQITALTKMHGRAVTLVGREYCQNLTLELPSLSEKEWHAFRDGYVKPVITSAKGPMWDVDARSREELDVFTKVVY